MNIFEVLHTAIRESASREPKTNKPLMKTRLHAFTYGAALLLTCLLAGTPRADAQQADAGWSHFPAVLKKITPPVFPKKDFLVKDYGFPSGENADCLPAIKKAIAACHAAGGGRVVIPAGTHFVQGPIHLLSGVNLHLEKGCLLLFSTNPDDYLPVVLTRFEGMELMNYSPLVYAFGQHDIAVTGEGILDGQADNAHWWNWTGSKRFGWQDGMGAQHDPANEPALTKMAAQGVPVKQRIFGKGHYMRPSFLEVYRCKNVLIQGITIRNTPFWVLHPTLSTNVTIDSVTTTSLGPNNDGCDPESCDGVLIKNCAFRNGDDCIAIKSGRNEDGRRINVPSQNIIVENCHMEDGHGGVVIGSETSGGVRNVYVQDCHMDSKNLDRAIRIKSNACRGGKMGDFYFRRLRVGQVREAVVRINMFYGGKEDNACGFPPTLSGVYVSDVTSEKSAYAVFIEGRSDKPVDHVEITDCTFGHVEKENIVKDATHVAFKNVTINGSPAHP